jgi:ankyrin repeat protein
MKTKFHPYLKLLDNIQSFGVFGYIPWVAIVFAISLAEYFPNPYKSLLSASAIIAIITYGQWRPEKKWLSAVEDENYELVEDFLKSRGNINSRTLTGINALHVAASKSSEEMSKLLLKNGINIDASDLWGTAALHIASCSKTSSILSILIENGANLNIQDEKGRTPLHFAAFCNLNNLIILIENGADLNIQDEKGRTPLHIAVVEKNVEATKALLIAGADQSIKNENSLNPHEIAVLSNDECIISLFSIDI